MAYKNDKLRDLTPLQTSFVPGESPSAEKLQAMIRQADSAVEYLENKIGDLAGEEKSFNTWVATLARNIGDFSKLNPSILPSYEQTNYQQQLTAGRMEHELDLVPVGELDNLIESTNDSSVTISKWKNSASLLLEPGDWTIELSYTENGNLKRGRKLVTHSPSNGGSITFKKVTSGRGSSLENNSENTIPSLAQAENGGPFAELEIIDSATRQYLVTLPVRTKMYDKLGQIVDFTASNSKAAVGLNSQYELPDFFFNTSGLDLESDDSEGNSKEIPLNLITLYDWEEKKEIEGIISLKASPTQSARRYQFVLQTRLDVILNTATGKYIFAVAGNSINDQIKAIADAVYNNTGNGTEMMRLLSHKNLLNLRTGSISTANRSAYYGASSIDNNDHSMYFHRNGFTDSDKGGGGNVIRGNVVIGSTTTGTSDSVHENFNVSSDSNFLYFGNIAKGPSLKYIKTLTHTIDHSYGGLPTGITDCGLLITGAVSDLNSSRKNVFIEGDIRTSGNVVLGKLSSDVIFMQGKVYVNDELTLIPRVTTGITGEEGKVLYSSTEKALVYYNGNSWVSPWRLSGYTTTVGDGVNSFGKYNGASYATINSALADVSSGGVLKILPGTYNILGNKISLPANVTIEGSGDLTVITGTGVIFENTGSNVSIKNLKIQGSGSPTVTTGIRNNSSNLKIENVSFSGCATGVEVTISGTNLRVLDGVTYPETSLPIFYSATTLNTSYRTVVKSALNYAGSSVEDWSLKQEILKDYFSSSSTVSITYDPTLDGAIGVGAFKVNGSGTVVCRKLLPVNVNVGIGGNINIMRLGTTGTASAGVFCFDKNGQNIGSRAFIMSSVPLGANAIDSAGSFYKNVMVGTSGFTGLMFPSGTKFVQPYIDITSNNSGVVFDSFEVSNMTYARVGTWS